ncbi:hypothetical protein NA57DRAFT_66421 [Rhizodiscina lignyota]|uniref:Protein sip5 n=1 Tax=Rhizodiscina lignyota TaxID=1504668 RepID=A0A9P4M5C1_9PEZI|nr:hypothetical protein NA57DRAFT_66421 [Rhizodiscina lignyota]
MGNSAGKEARSDRLSQSRSNDSRTGDPSSPTAAAGSSQAQPGDNPGGRVYSSGRNRGSRHDLSFLGLGGNSDRDPAQPEPRRETKAEREARKLEKERELRKKERERSIKEEGVDGGYLVTLGTYTGTEDFNKSVVRQLMIERRLAPFWRGLNDHSDTWTEHQLVAVARGLPLPAADEIPPEDTSRNTSQTRAGERAADVNINHLTVPITSRSQSYTSDTSATLSPSHPAFSSSAPPPGVSQSTPFFKGRAKALAALKTSSNAGSQTDMTPQEIQLPKDPYVNGQQIEVFLYKDASECPICFLYYPPYLNKTRCCDQPICSECFVQIKRPDPHPPEHHDDPDNPNTSNGSNGSNGMSEHQQPPPPEEENMLVCEPAACPFCVQPEFGVTYEPPPFRRGLVYAIQGRGLSAMSATSAMSSSSSLNSQGMSTPGGTNTGRRRTTSLSASAPSVITTDRVRPDWAKKLSDARAHALRRAAAATALHNAAYVLGNVGGSDGRGLLGRRRRMFASIGDSGSANGSGNRERERGANLPGGENTTSGRGSRRTRMEDLEELMMMEAIRLSLASEEERRRKEEKEEVKRLKKEEKRAAKEAKKAEKAQRKSSGGMMYTASSNASTISNFLASGSAQPQTPVDGKGKAIDRGSPPSMLNEPGASVADIGSGPSSPREDPQRHLEHSRAQIQNLPGSDANSRAPTPAINITDSPTSGNHRSSLRHLSNASSSASSLNESIPGSVGNTSGGLEPNPTGVNHARTGSAIDIVAAEDPLTSETPPGGGAGTEPMFNFRSLAEVIGNEEGQGKDDDNAERIENVTDNTKLSANPGPNANLGRLSPESVTDTSSLNRSRGDSGESSNSSVPPDVAEVVQRGTRKEDDEMDIGPAPVPLAQTATQASNPYDAKHFGDISVLDPVAQETIHRNVPM